MPKIDPNSTEFDGGAGILGAGTHLAFIANIDVGQSENKGTPYVEFEFECHDPDSPNNGKSLRYQRYYITDSSTWRFVQVCRAARPDGCPPVDTDSKTELERELLDRPLNITVELKQQSGYKDKLETVGVDAITAAQERRLRSAYNGELVPPMEGDAPKKDTFSDDEIPY